MDHSSGPMKPPHDHAQATDPVCGMRVDRASARHFARHAWETFWFCAGGVGEVSR